MPADVAIYHQTFWIIQSYSQSLKIKEIKGKTQLTSDSNLAAAGPAPYRDIARDRIKRLNLNILELNLKPKTPSVKWTTTLLIIMYDTHSPGFAQIAKIIGSTSIRPRRDAYESNRGLRVFAILLGVSLTVSLWNLTRATVARLPMWL